MWAAGKSYHVGYGSLAVGEQSVEALHPHWKMLMWPVVSACVVVAALLVGEVLIPSGRDAAIERLAAAAFAVVLLMSRTYVGRAVPAGRGRAAARFGQALRMTGAPTRAERRGTLRKCD